jgi:hypothetical protein
MSTHATNAFICALQLPLPPLLINLSIVETGSTLSGTESPETPSIHSTLNPVIVDAKSIESRRSVRSGRFMTKIFSNPRVLLEMLRSRLETEEVNATDMLGLTFGSHKVTSSKLKKIETNTKGPEYKTGSSESSLRECENLLPDISVCITNVFSKNIHQMVESRI